MVRRVPDGPGLSLKLLLADPMPEMVAIVRTWITVVDAPKAADGK